MKLMQEADTKDVAKDTDKDAKDSKATEKKTATGASVLKSQI